MVGRVSSGVLGGGGNEPVEGRVIEQVVGLVVGKRGEQADVSGSGKIRAGSGGQREAT